MLRCTRRLIQAVRSEYALLVRGLASVALRCNDEMHEVCCDSRACESASRPYGSRLDVSLAIDIVTASNWLFLVHVGELISERAGTRAVVQI